MGQNGLTDLSKTCTITCQSKKEHLTKSLLMIRMPPTLRALPLALVIFVNVCLLAIKAQADFVVVPNYCSTNQPDSPGGDLREILREQLVYGASEFPPYPIIINQIHWRPDMADVGPISTTISNIQINLSTTLKGADQLSATFSENLGTNDMTVFSGAMIVICPFTTLSNGTKGFDINLPLQTPFFYDPSKGNLLLDVRNFTGCDALLYDNVIGNNSDSVSRILSLGDASAMSASIQDSTATIIEIDYIPASLPPTVSSQPTNQTAFANGAATISAKVNGNPPFNYQWFFNNENTPVEGATNASLVLKNLQLNQQGNYFLRVTNLFGQAQSSNALLTITAQPVITLQPNSQTEPLGADVSFFVSVGGVAPLSFLWFYNNTNPIVGATNSFLTVSNIQFTSEGSYSVHVSNSYGSTNSINAILFVGVIAPNYTATNQCLNSGNDLRSVLREQLVYGASEFPSYPIIIGDIRWRPDLATGIPITTTVSNIQVNLSTTKQNADRLSSTFSENIGTNDTVVFSGHMDVVSSFTTLVNGTKAFDINLPLQTLFFYDPSKGNLLLDIHNFTGCNSLLYDNLVSGSSDAVSRAVSVGDADAITSSLIDSTAPVIEFGFTATPVPPIVRSEPTNQSILVGGNTTFSIAATGAPPLKYQWFLNDTNNPIVGATDNSLTLGNLQLDQAGNYFVQVTNAYGATLSSNAALVIVATGITSQPINQLVPLGGTAIFTVAAGGIGPFVYQWYLNTTNAIAGATNASLSLTNVQFASEGTYSVQISNSYGSTNSANANLFVEIAVVIPNYAATNQPNGAGGDLRQILRDQLVYGASEFPPYPIVINEIHWRPDSADGGAINTAISNIQVNLSTTPMSADHLSSTFAQNTGTNDTVVFSGAVNVVSSFVNLSNGTKTFDIKLPLQIPFFYDPRKGNLLVDIRNFTGCNALLYNNILSYSSDTVSRIGNLGDPNAANANFGDSGAAAIEIGYTSASFPPIIDSQPTNRSVAAGLTTSFSILAGPQPLAYQWFFTDTNNPIFGATNSSLTLSNIQQSQAGNYLVMASNPYGSTLSSNALLTVTADPPAITLQPADYSVIVGTNFTFSVSAFGSLPLAYQWYYNTNTLLDGATNSSLMLTNIQFNETGTYSVIVSNAYGVTNSSNAVLTISFPPVNVLVGSTNVMGGVPLTLPVLFGAHGNENALSFSMSFNTQQLTYASIDLGSGAADATLFPNTSQIPNGRLGVTMQLPAGETFVPGTQEVARVTFLSSFATNTPVTTPVNFTNQPVARAVFDVHGIKLATNFIGGSVTLTVSDFEADVTPRTNGDHSLDIFDWNQVGRFVAGLDTVSNASEFQRADCAPKSTSGDGQLKVTDWVQAGRYGAVIDTPSVFGGPNALVTPVTLTGGPRTITVTGGIGVKGLNFTVPVILQSQGDETAVGLSVNFDPTLLKYVSTAKGSADGSATLLLNTNQAASGTVGVLLALQSGTSFTNGTQSEIAKFTFTALNTTTNGIVAPTNGPVLLAISDTSANELPAIYTNSAVTINPPPTLDVGLSDTNAVMTWPTWGIGFILQATGDLTQPWTNVVFTAQTNGGNIIVTVPLPSQGGYFRLHHP
jgi:hypothetical protein